MATVEREALNAIRQGNAAMFAFLLAHGHDIETAPFRGGYKLRPAKEICHNWPAREAVILTVVDVALGTPATEDEVREREAGGWWAPPAPKRARNTRLSEEVQAS